MRDYAITKGRDLLEKVGYCLQYGKHDVLPVLSVCKIAGINYPALVYDYTGLEGTPCHATLKNTYVILLKTESGCECEKNEDDKWELVVVVIQNDPQKWAGKNRRLFGEHGFDPMGLDSAYQYEAINYFDHKVIRLDSLSPEAIDVIEFIKKEGSYIFVDEVINRYKYGIA